MSEVTTPIRYVLDTDTVTHQPFAEQATEIHQRLLAQKLRIGAQDLQIAAIVLAHDAILVTANQRHFAQVPALQLEDWTRVSS